MGPHRPLVCAAPSLPLSRSVSAASKSSETNAFSAKNTQIASMVAGVLSRVLLHPFDCIKTRLQYMRRQSSAIDPGKAVLRFIAAERIGGLYRGIFGATIGVIPYSLLYMPSYEAAQQQLSRGFSAKELFGLRHVLAGSFAGLCGSLVKVPVDVVKKRVQAGLYPNVFVAMLSIFNEGHRNHGSNIYSLISQRALGVRYFYAGWRSSVLYEVPYNAVQFLVLENVKRLGRFFRRGEQFSRRDNVTIGALTGMITSLLTEPLDVIKTRMMTQRALSTQSYNVTLYRGWLHCLITMVKEEGIPVLWRGSLPRLFWVGASSAIWYGTYQAVRQGLSNRQVNKATRTQETFAEHKNVYSNPR